MTFSRFARTAAAAALLGLGAAGCGSQVGAPSGNPSPTKLNLASSAPPAPSASPATTPVPAVALPAPPGIPGWAHVKLTGKLPASGPASGAVRDLPGGAAAEATVDALAAALHLTGSPQHVSGGWRVTGGGSLQVSDGPGRRWVFIAAPAVLRCLGPIGAFPKSPPVASGAGAGGAAGGVAGKAASALPTPRARACPMRPGQLEPAEPLPVPTGGAPSARSAQAAAAPALQAAGAGAAPLRITTIGSYTFVSADPTVDGLPTAGLSTTIGVGPGARIGQASGWLSRPLAGTRYPLVTAARAFGELKASTHPAGGHPPEVMCPLDPDVLCGTPGPIRLVQVTGAVYGLALSYDNAVPVLVPAWLFSVAGSGLRVPEVAIDPRYLTR